MYIITMQIDAKAHPVALSVVYKTIQEAQKAILNPARVGGWLYRIWTIEDLMQPKGAE